MVKQKVYEILKTNIIPWLCLPCPCVPCSHGCVLNFPLNVSMWSMSLTLTNLKLKEMKEFSLHSQVAVLAGNQTFSPKASVFFKTHDCSANDRPIIHTLQDFKTCLRSGACLRGTCKIEKVCTFSWRKDNIASLGLHNYGISENLVRSAFPYSWFLSLSTVHNWLIWGQMTLLCPVEFWWHLWSLHMR